MIAYAALGLLLLLVIWLLLRAFVGADPATVARYLRIVGAVVLVVVAVLLIWSGRIGPAMVAFSFILPLFIRWRALRQRVRAAAGPSKGQTTDVDTRFVAMTLDHDSGAVEGMVKDGMHAGRALDSLSIPEALELLNEARVDEESARVIEGWLDRAHPDWRDFVRAEPEPPAGRGRMTPEEALDVLGLAPGASEEEIRAAHRRLMMANHPDRGGSTYIAAQINQAKDVLLGDQG